MLIVLRCEIEHLCSYDAQSAIALVRAAERSKSPAILQLFPVTLAYGKGPFLQFCLNMYVHLCSMFNRFVPNACDSAHQASVPIAVHLDHATDPEHIELALSLAEQGIAFDSIMVDASHAEVAKIVLNVGRLLTSVRLMRRT